MLQILWVRVFRAFYANLSCLFRKISRLSLSYLFESAPGELCNLTLFFREFGSGGSGSRSFSEVLKEHRLSEDCRWGRWVRCGPDDPNTRGPCVRRWDKLSPYRWGTLRARDHRDHPWQVFSRDHRPGICRFRWHWFYVFPEDARIQTRFVRFGTISA